MDPEAVMQDGRVVGTADLKRRRRTLRGSVALKKGLVSHRQDPQVPSQHHIAQPNRLNRPSFPDVRYDMTGAFHKDGYVILFRFNDFAALAQ